MTLEEKLSGELKNAMKAKDSVSLRGLRAIKQAIILKKTDGTGEEIDEALEVKMLQKLVKERKDSLEIYESQNREDLAKVEREEIEVIEKFLPKQMEEAALEAYLKALMEKLGATSMKDMGKIMGAANKELSGKADGKAISMKVKQLLS